MQKLLYIIITLGFLFVGEAKAQDFERLWITGTAVPQGTVELTKRPDGLFRYSGSLKDGELKIMTTETFVKNTTRFLKPVYVDSYLINNGLRYAVTFDETQPGWVVSFSEETYYLLVDTKNYTVRGELFLPWNEVLLAGSAFVGGSNNVEWHREAMLPFERDHDNPYVFTWTGQLGEYANVVEPGRFKLEGQMTWGPRELHPFVQDEDILQARQLRRGGDDTKWHVSVAGTYRITVNLFQETIHAELLATSSSGSASAVAPRGQEGSGVYVGGHIRRERPQTVVNLKNSGFTYAILFNVNVEKDGTLTTDGETICKNGEYVFHQQQPHYVDDVRALKTWPTAIERVEICIGGWGNESYANIRDLINQYGTGENTVLYQNFKALKDMLPEIDAVNNDDEHCYDVNTAVKFHAMMADLGFKTTVAPYTNKTFWSSLVEQLNKARTGACDRILVQCYDGGAANNPSDWHLGGLSVHAGRTNYQTDMQTSVSQMQNWHDANGVSGGFVWVYNDETWNLNQWASAMNRIFGAAPSESPVATFYNANNFGGYSVSLPEGVYCTGELSAHGITDKDISSFKMEPGYRMTCYATNDLTGTNKVWTETEQARMGAWAKRISSLKIERVDGSAINTVSATDQSAPSRYYDLQGRRLSSKPLSGFFLEEKDGIIRKSVVQSSYK